MNEIKIPFFELFKRSVNYVMINMAYLFKLAIIPVIICTFTEIIDKTPATVWIFKLINLSISTFVAVWWCRLVVLNETVSFGDLKLSIVGRYLLKYIVFIGILIAPALIALLVTSSLNGISITTIAEALSGAKVLNQEMMQALSLPILIAIITSIFCIRLRMSLASTAVGDNEISFALAWKLTRGNTFNLLIALFMMVIPLIFVSQIVVMALQVLPDTFLMTCISIFVVTFLAMIIECFYASFDAHVYQYFVYFYRKAIEDGEAQEAGNLIEEKIKSRRD